MEQSAKSNLAQRALTGFIIAGLAVFVVVYSPYGLLLLATLVSTLGVWELHTISGLKKRYKTSGLLLTLAIMGLFLLKQMEISQFSPFNLLYLALPIIGLQHLVDSKMTDALTSISRWVLGIVYCVLPLMLFIEMPSMLTGEYQFWIPLGLMILNYWMDTLAYFCGRFLGKHLMAPRISPKKTWEGVIGGAIGTIILGTIFHLYLPETGINWLVITAIILVFNQPGDLIESLFKRSVQIKDSGSILPGHGGMLDRFDSLFVIIPIVYFYLSLIK